MKELLVVAQQKQLVAYDKQDIPVHNKRPSEQDKGLEFLVDSSDNSVKESDSSADSLVNSVKELDNLGDNMDNSADNLVNSVKV